MANLNVKERPDASPTACVACNTHDRGPFLDTDTELPHGHVWVCIGTDEEPGCVLQAAQMVGWRSPTFVAELTEEFDNANARIAELEAELEVERTNKVVSLEDAATLLGKKIKVPAGAGERG